MEILPNGPSDRARDSDVVLETGPAFRNGGLNQLLDGRPAFGPEMTNVAFVPKLPVTSCIPDDQAANATIADEDIGAEAEHEAGNLPLPSRENCIRQLVGGGRLIVQVRRSANILI